MSSYTLELRTIIEQASQDVVDLSHRDRIEIGRKKLFDFPYPIFDENYRAVFETNFIRNFYTREIGFETEGLFKFKLDTWLNINMPYYNKLYESELIQFDPLESYSLKTTYQRKNDTIQTDEDIYLQSVKTTDEENETMSSSQSGTTNRLQNDSKELTQNLETNATDSTESQELSESTVENESDKELNTNVEETSDRFNRNLKSNTPDSRLSITPNEDGTGVIEYASEIVEDKTTDKKMSTSETDEKAIDTQISEGTIDTSSESTSQTKTETNENETISTNENVTASSNDSSTRNKSNVFNNNTNSTNQGKKNINDIEDYIEEKVGSIGVKTYSEMINEYRSILLRIEKDLFYEMNELFMLVY